MLTLTLTGHAISGAFAIDPKSQGAIDPKSQGAIDPKSQGAIYFNIANTYPNWSRHIRGVCQLFDFLTSCRAGGGWVILYHPPLDTRISMSGKLAAIETQLTKLNEKVQRILDGIQTALLHETPVGVSPTQSDEEDEPLSQDMDTDEKPLSKKPKWIPATQGTGEELALGRLHRRQQQRDQLLPNANDIGQNSSNGNTTSAQRSSDAISGTGTNALQQQHIIPANSH